MGVVSIAVPFSDRWYFTELIAGATTALEAAGHTARLHVVPPAPGATATAATLIERDLAEDDSIGAIAGGFKYQADQSARVLAWRRPVVVIGGSVLGFPAVLLEDAGIAQTAVRHLLDRGHTRIVHFGGSAHHQMDFSVDGRRAKGYVLAMESAGLRPEIIENEWDDEGTYQAAAALFAAPDRPTAVFAVSDEIAFPILAAALQIGGQLSVVGVDDHPRSEAEGLTTLRQRPREIGGTAVELVLSGLSHGPDPNLSRLHPVALVKRASTARLR